MEAHQPLPVYPQRMGEQDCRDYLRTGRCKYGESCKYNHPPNVQNGGGIRSADPNEPAFPIRPNEPPCQYFLKHGTCKFGQTCKFHHPSHILATGGGSLSGTVLMNVVSTSQVGGSGQQFIALNDGSGGMGELQQVVQLLPQRPGEPDCIYFLRNGRCKYGATCKYHHPLTNTPSHQHQQQQRQHQDQGQAYVQRVGRDRSASAGSTAERMIQYVPTSHGGGGGPHGNYGQQRHGEPQQFIVSDGSLRVMTISSSNQQTPGGRQPSYQQQQASSHTGSPVIASSSVASSYETASSSLEYLAASQSQGQFSHHQQEEIAVDSSGRIWRRTSSQDHLSTLSGHRPPSQEHLSSLAGRRPPSQEQLASLAGRRTISQERLPSLPQGQGSGSGGNLVGSQQGQGGYEASTMSRHGSFTGGRMGVDLTSGSSESDGGKQQQQPQHYQVSSLRRAAAAETSKMAGQQHHQHQQYQGQDGRSHVSSYGGGTSYASSAGQVDVLRNWPTLTPPHSNRGPPYNPQEYNQVPRVPSGSYLSSNAPEFAMEEEDYYRGGERYPPPPEDPSSSGGAAANNRATGQGGGGHRETRQTTPREQQQQSSGNNNEEGLSMMTSALLNMLDTTEHDAGGRDANEDKTSPPSATAAKSSSAPYQRQQSSSSAPGTPIQRGSSAPRSPLGFDEGSSRRVDNSSVSSRDVSPRQRIRYQGSVSMPTHQEDFVPTFASHPRQDREDNPPPPHRAGDESGPSSWQPTWRHSHSHELEHNAQSVSVLQSANSAQASHASHGGGFYEYLP